MMSVISFSNIQCSEVNRLGSTASMSARLILLFNNIYNNESMGDVRHDEVPGHLVEGHGEAPVYVVSVEHGYTHDPPNKVEI